MFNHVITRTIIAAAAVPAFVACASMSHNDTSSAGGTVTLTGQPVLRPLRASEEDLLRRMTDPNILGHLAMSDSVEVVMAKFAELRTKDDDVLEFARDMDVDHSTSLDRERRIADQTGLGMHTMVGELKVSHMGTLVDSIGPQISEMTFNHNYVVSQVQMHSHLLEELNTLYGVAQNEEVRRHIAALRPIVRAHLVKAHDLAVKRQYLSASDWTGPAPR